ncbi:MAG: cell wall metabolism sensor histidine kinase WalK [Gemmataceae bacterium]|nr:cell wall metabolism sensor histidine kinase WalK [Gemmataceae bacterium]
MFRRLLASFAALAVLLVLAAAGAVLLLVEEQPLRARLLLALSLVLALGLAAAGLLAASLSQHFGRPLQHLIAAVEKMGEGSGSPRVYPLDRDEASVLGQAFNRMSEHLGQRIAALEDDRQQMRTILSGMVEGVVALDAGQRILFANERACELLEFPGPPPVGRPLWEVVRHRVLLDTVRQALRTSQPRREELAWAGDTPRSLTVHAARLPGEAPRGAVVVLHDTTELRRLERLRREFVANVSHELKTPLSVIKVCVETLLDGAMDDPAARVPFLERVARQGDRLHALILDLLSLARIESGEELFDFRAVPLAPLAEACLERHLPRAEAKRQALSLEPGPEGLAAWADEEAVDQILENLLDNAVKYTPEGGSITVRLQREGGAAVVEVRDTGIGIPEADLPRVFERFYRVDKARSRELGGTGLGLSIVKHLAQALRGGVRAASQPGKGTAFLITLPLADGPVPDSAPSSRKTHNPSLQ